MLASRGHFSADDGANITFHLPSHGYAIALAFLLSDSLEPAFRNAGADLWVLLRQASDGHIQPPTGYGPQA